MQTFLPYPDFIKSAEVLDNKRLGKQRVEAHQILKALANSSYGWQNHPAVKMWRGYEDALKFYYNCILSEWCWRGFKNNMKFEKIKDHPSMPPWLGDEAFHLSHRANLLRKDQIHYSQFGWTADPTMPYIWPEMR